MKVLSAIGLAGLAVEGGLLLARHNLAQRELQARQKATTPRGPIMERIPTNATKRQRDDALARNVARIMARAVRPSSDARRLAELVAWRSYGRPVTREELARVASYVARAAALLRAPELASVPGGAPVRWGLVLALRSGLRDPARLWRSYARARQWLRSPAGKAWAREHYGSTVKGQTVTLFGLLGEVALALDADELARLASWPRNVTKAFTAVNQVGPIRHDSHE